MLSTKKPIPKLGKPLTGFESLAPEILLLILQDLPDLVSLDSVLRASPSSFRLFDSYGTEIMDTVISSREIHGHIRAMIRVTALIRTSKLPMDNLADFQEKTTISAMQERVRSLKTNVSPLRLEPNTSPPILRGILASNRHLTQLSLKLLKIYLRRFRAAKPRQLATSVSVDFKNLDELLEVPEDLWEEYPVKNPGSPNWAEEQRAIRAFWRIQVFHDMKKAAVKGRLPGWSELDIRTLKKMTLSSFYGASHAVQAVTPMDESTPHPEYHELTSVAVYLRENYGLYDLTHITKLSCFTPPYPPIEVNREWSNESYGCSQFEPWRKGIGIVSIQSTESCHFYLFMFLQSFKKRVPFEQFGRLGFAFWGYRRMCGYGLSPPVFRYSADGACTAKWCSMLDKEVLSNGEESFENIIGGYPSQVSRTRP